MPLTLTIRNVRLDNGSPQSLILDRRGAIIGRAPTVDWCLPDPTMHVSSRHCEIQFNGTAYVMTDISTNGTFLQGQDARLIGPHSIQAGDVFVIGQYEVVAALDAASATAMAQSNAAPPPPEWQGWAGQGGEAAPAASASGWGAVPTGSAMSGAGPMSQSWAAPSAAAAAPSVSPPPAARALAAEPLSPTPAAGWGAPAAAARSEWGAGAASSAPGGGWGAPSPSPSTPLVASTWTAAPEAGAPASGWSTPVGASPSPPTPDDVWGKIAASNVVDWARGGFGAPAAPPPPLINEPVGLPASAPMAAGWGDKAAASAMPPQPVSPPPMPVSAPPMARPVAADLAPPPNAPGPVPAAASATAFVAALGIDPAALKGSDQATLATGGDLLRRLVAGLVVMMEARARAKSQMGAQGTSLEFDGNNPLKFARTPEQALAQLLNPTERGFMPAERAIEDAFRDLQAHQIATLRAMQGALRATLDRFSPTAIRARADTGGLLSKVLPGARDAALWKAYEREFGGVAQGSDEAFMDVFAKEFRKAYEDAARAK